MAAPDRSDAVDPHRSVRHRRLFAPSRVAYADVDLTFALGPVDPDLVARMHLVALTAEHRVLVCASDLGWRFLPGGTREPGESVAALAARELMEEAGAVVSGPLHLFGAHAATSHATEPYRPHLPHPRSLWAYAVCRAEVVGEPTAPEGGETITEVLALPPDEAVAYLADHDQLLADVLALAIDLGLTEAY